jgi:hypothetical protein
MKHCAPLPKKKSCSALWTPNCCISGHSRCLPVLGQVGAVATTEMTREGRAQKSSAPSHESTPMLAQPKHNCPAAQDFLKSPASQWQARAALARRSWPGGAGQTRWPGAGRGEQKLLAGTASQVMRVLQGRGSLPGSRTRDRHCCHSRGLCSPRTQQAQHAASTPWLRTSVLGGSPD